MQQNDAPLLPNGAVQHMFLPGRQLTALTSLTLEASLEYTGDDLARLCFMSATELGYLVSACPALAHLAICNALGRPCRCGEASGAAKELPTPVGWRRGVHRRLCVVTCTTDATDVSGTVVLP